MQNKQLLSYKNEYLQGKTNYKLLTPTSGTTQKVSDVDTNKAVRTNLDT